MTDLAQALIEEQEGLRLFAYKDTRGLWTIGYGHRLADQTRDYTGFVWTAEQAEFSLTQDMTTAREIAAIFPHFGELNDVRQAVLISMAFQMGTGPIHWPVFMAALTASDFNAAADAGLDSEWAKIQTPVRANLEMSMLRTGQWELPA